VTGVSTQTTAYLRYPVFALVQSKWVPYAHAVIQMTSFNGWES